MKYFLNLFSLGVCVCLLGCQAPIAEDPGKEKKAVFIILDGIPADVIERVNTPNLDEIARDGGYTRAFMGGQIDHISQSPTISAVGYNTLITGTWAHKHNVYGNGIKDPNYNYWNIFRILETVDNTTHSAIFSTWLDNRTKLVGEGLAAAGNIKLDYAFDGFEIDTVRFPHLPDRKFIFDIDELVSKETERYISEVGPDISWVYLEFTDDMGHKFGDSPEQEEAVIAADIQVGRIWNAVKKRQQENNEEWMILITTDHGRKPDGGFGHGGQTERERIIWYFTNVNNLNDRFTDQPGMVDGIPSILRFMNIEVPADQLLESDGVPFIGPISIANATVQRTDNNLTVSWKHYDAEGDVEISIATTDNFETGGADTYTKVGTVPAGDDSYSFDISTIDPTLVKVLLKARHNTTNVWYTE